MDFTQVSSVRATYALTALLLIVALINQLEGLVAFIVLLCSLGLYQENILLSGY
jgi:hypothetical protein